MFFESFLFGMIDFDYIVVVVVVIVVVFVFMVVGVRVFVGDELWCFFGRFGFDVDMFGYMWEFREVDVGMG